MFLKLKKKKIYFQISYTQFITAFIICCSLLAIGGVIYYSHRNTRPESLINALQLEALEPMQNTVPEDVKKQIRYQQQYSSISATVRVPILFYHYVEYVKDKKDTIRQSLTIPPNIFEQQIQTLQNAGYEFMTAKDLGDVLDGKMSLPKNPVLITFDDGHWDLDTTILPILKKYHVKATAYIVPGFLGGSDFLTQKQLQEVINSGLIDIGAHTVHHVSLKGKLLPLVITEVTQSKVMLEQLYHLHVVSFAYPYGTFDTQAISVVRNAGFTTAVSTIPGILQNQTNRFFLYRIRPGYRIGQVLLQYLHQDTFSPYE